MWSQTPQFTLTLKSAGGVDIDINVHHGVIKSLEAKGGSQVALEKIQATLVEQKLQDIGDWNEFLRSRIEPWDDGFTILADRLEELLPVPRLATI